MSTFQAFIDRVMMYLEQMVWLAIPAGIIFLCFWPYRKRALAAMKLKTSLLREAALLIFVMTVFSILAVTLRPYVQWSEDAGLWGNVTLMIHRSYPLENVNLQPFYMLRIFKACVNLGDVVYILINFVGNMWVFVPMGFFPALLFRGGSWVRSAAIGAVFSALIEFGQYFIMRNTDIDDVILNAAGALMGYWLYLLLKKLLPGFTARFLCSKI